MFLGYGMFLYERTHPRRNHRKKIINFEEISNWGNVREWRNLTQFSAISKLTKINFVIPDSFPNWKLYRTKWHILFQWISNSERPYGNADIRSDTKMYMSMLCFFLLPIPVSKSVSPTSRSYLHKSLINEKSNSTIICKLIIYSQFWESNTILWISSRKAKVYSRESIPVISFAKVNP